MATIETEESAVTLDHEIRLIEDEENEEAEN